MRVEETDSVMMQLGRRARVASEALAQSSSQARNTAIEYCAKYLRKNALQIQAANALDMQAARAASLSNALLDRLMLDDARIEAMAQALEEIAALEDPLGKSLERWQRPNGLEIERVSVPLGVIAIIYESRPNVTADAGAICLKAGNAVILRGGSESAHSSQAIVSVLRAALSDAQLNPDAIQMLPSQDRALVSELLGGLGGQIDVVVPRGGRGLIERVQADARVPVIGHLEGICHVFLHASASTPMAVDIVVNSKMRRTGICGAAETLLIDERLSGECIASVFDALIARGCELRGCENARAQDSRVIAAAESDWSCEYLDSILAVKFVSSTAAAIAHIRQYGSGHTESIVCEDASAQCEFLNGVDSAIVMHNASTQFADGGEFGMGAEIGISTSRIHARGPVGAAQLTSYKYIVRGTGQTRA